MAGPSDYVGALLQSDNPELVALAGTLVNQFEVLNAQSNLVNQNTALSYQQDALAQAREQIARDRQAEAEGRAANAAERARLAIARGDVAQKQHKADAANAANQLGLSREDLFMNLGINYRNIANRFGTSGLGDSGFSDRSRGQFAAARILEDDKLQTAFDHTIDNINRQVLLTKNSTDSAVLSARDAESGARDAASGAAANALDAQNRLISNASDRVGLSNQQLALEAARLDLAGIAYGALAQAAPVGLNTSAPPPSPSPTAPWVSPSLGAIGGPR